MNKRDALDRIQAIEQEAEALRKVISGPETVTAAIGDLVAWSSIKVFIASLSEAGLHNYNVRCIGDEPDKEIWIVPLSCLKTLDGKEIDAVVPFRIFKRLDGRCEVIGEISSYPSLEDSHRSWNNEENAKKAADFMVKTLWPWYEGPSCYVEEESAQ